MAVVSSALVSCLCLDADDWLSGLEFIGIVITKTLQAGRSSCPVLPDRVLDGQPGLHRCSMK